MSNGEEQGFSMILWQLQQYQRVIRNWDPYLDPYEFKVVMLILDRTIGWKKRKATFRPSRLLNGDKEYSGFGKTMSRSKLMKVLRDLEDRGMIARRWDADRPGLKSYSVNLDWLPDALDQQGLTGDAAHTPLEGVSVRHRGVSTRDCDVVTGDTIVSIGDPEEAYREKAILEQYSEDSSVDPRPSASDQRPLDFSPERSAGNRTVSRQTAPAINPPLRRRRVV